MPSKKRNSLFHFFLSMMVLIKFFIAIKAQYMVEILERTALGSHRAVVRCDATGANFGEDVLTFTFGINNIGCALPAEPTMACSDVLKPELNSTTQCLVDFAVVPRGNCSFSEKAYYVQTAKPVGYTALIVYNLKGQSPIPMSGSKYAELVQIPVVMVKYECMQSMLGHYTAERGYLITIKSSSGYYDLIKYLFPFVIIVGICFVVLFISLMIRLCRERRRLSRKRLPRSQLKKIPTKKYRKGDPEETCAICLEDFQESEKLRILACRHAYHCKCIDPWLTRSRKVCPVCKRRVGPRNDDSSDSDETDNERATSNESIASGIAESTSTMLAMSNRDNDPLLQNAQPIATSSHDLPYPQNTISSIQQPSTSTPNGFLRATRNLLNLSNFTQSSRCELFHNHVNTALGNNNTSTRETTTFVEPRQTSPIHSSPEIEDLSNTVQQQIQQQPNANSRQYGRFSLVNIGSRLAGLVRQGASSASLSNGANPPHILLENEEDASTTVTREDLDTLSRNICESTDETASNSGDGHSMTTQHSNHNLVLVKVETPPPSLQPTIATLPMERTDNV